MTKHNLFYYSYASFTKSQLPLLKVAAMHFNTRVIIDPVGASWATIGADYPARHAVEQLRNAGILHTVTPADVLAEYAAPITDAIRQDMHNKEFLYLCEARGSGRWTLSPAKVPHRTCRPTRPCAT